MRKKSVKNKRHSFREKKTNTTKNRKASESKRSRQKLPWLFSIVLYNVVGMFFYAVLCTYSLYGKSPYKWVFSNLLRSNVSYVTKYIDNTNDEKKTAKLGFAYKIVDQIKSNTPDSAVILFPFLDKHVKDDSFRIKGFKQKPHLTLMNKNWVSSFLYPRRALMAYDLNTDINKDRITHVAIIDQLGQEHIDSRIDISQGRLYIIPYMNKK